MTQHEKHQNALDTFIRQVQHDSNVIALLLVGSLSYGTVWKRSDIDLVVIVRDGAIPKSINYCVDEGDVEFHIDFQEVSRFKSYMQKNRTGSQRHGFYGKGTMVFSKDNSLSEFFDNIKTLGKDDAALAALDTVSWVLSETYRAEKWITMFDDDHALLYAQRFIQRACTAVADMILIVNCEIPTRESILRASELEPDLMYELYVKPSTTRLSSNDIRHVLNVIDNFMSTSMDFWSKPVLNFLSDGEARKISEITRHFGAGDSFAFNFMAEKGLIERFTMPAKVFKNSKLTIEEVAYICPVNL